MPPYWYCFDAKVKHLRENLQYGLIFVWFFSCNHFTLLRWRSLSQGIMCKTSEWKRLVVCIFCLQKCSPALPPPICSKLQVGTLTHAGEHTLRRVTSYW